MRTYKLLLILGIYLAFFSLGQALLPDTQTLKAGMGISSNLPSMAPAQVQIPLIPNPELNLYSVQVQIGTPGQNYSLLIDTLCTSTMIPHVNSECSGDGCKGIKIKYDPKNSSTSDKFGIFGGGAESWAIEAASGDLYRDAMAVGPLKLPNASLSVMTEYEIPNESWDYDGILGLTTYGGYDFIDDLIAQNLLLNSSFSLYLKKDPKATGSVLVLGGIDPKYAASSFVYYPVFTHDIWVWTFETASFGNIPYVGNRHAAIATSIGHSLVNQLFYASILAVAPHKVDCSSISKYPNLVIKTGKTSLTFGPSYYYMPDSTGSQCTLGIKPWNGDGKTAIIVLGNNLLKAYYIHFDYINKQMGFATAANNNADFIEI